MMIKDSRAYRYAKWCAQRSNRKVGKYVKLQANKWLKIADGKHKEAYISEKAYRKICKLLKLMVHPDLHCSMYDGLEDYAWFLIAAVFCTRASSRPPFSKSPVRTSRPSTPQSSSFWGC